MEIQQSINDCIESGAIEKAVSLLLKESQRLAKMEEESFLFLSDSLAQASYAIRCISKENKSYEFADQIIPLEGKLAALVDQQNQNIEEYITILKSVIEYFLWFKKNYSITKHKSIRSRNAFTNFQTHDFSIKIWNQIEALNSNNQTIDTEKLFELMLKQIDKYKTWRMEPDEKEYSFFYPLWYIKRGFYHDFVQRINQSEKIKELIFKLIKLDNDLLSLKDEMSISGLKSFHARFCYRDDKDFFHEIINQAFERYQQACEPRSPTANNVTGSDI